jgi:MinD superfamily P-loop ATPase
VDAADLHLILEPRVLHRGEFSGGFRARIRPGHCTACGKCEELCRFDAVFCDGPGNGRTDKTFRVDDIACEGCGVCAYFCAEEAIQFAPAVNGQWFISETRCGPMVHAALGVAAENSGKLVHLVRTEAKKLAEQRELDLVIIDGAPGIGCPVIASITAASLVLVVTEPTLSGLHDLQRVADLTGHFGIETLVAINKWDLNRELSAEIESQVRGRGLSTPGKVRYDRAVTEAQVRRQAIVEYADEGASMDIRRLWSEIANHLKQSSPLPIC